MRIPWLTRKPTDGAAVAKIPITTDPKDCQKNTEHPPFVLRRLCCGLWGQDVEFSTFVHTVGMENKQCMCNKFIRCNFLSSCSQ